MDRFKRQVEDLFQDAATAKGVPLITPERVIIATPRPGQQEGALIPGVAVAIKKGICYHKPSKAQVKPLWKGETFYGKTKNYLRLRPRAR